MDTVIENGEDDMAFKVKTTPNGGLSVKSTIYSSPSKMAA